MKLYLYSKIATVYGFLAVGLGAFAAHGLKSHLNEYQLDIWQTGVFYQFVHTLLLFMISQQNIEKQYVSYVRWICIMLSLGILLFSFSLYLLALTQLRWLGAITPIGGVFLLLSWLMLFIYYFKLSKS